MSELKLCVKCHKEIKASGLDIGGKSFHLKCFRCHKCNKLLVGHGGCVFVNNEPTCQECVDAMQPGGHASGGDAQSTMICKMCGKSVDSGVKLGDDVFHKECFKCNECGVPLTGKFAEVSGHLVCQKCSEKILERNKVGAAETAPSKCFVCNKELEGSVVNVMDKKLHMECFRCGTCNHPLHDGKRKIAFDDGKFQCGECVEKKNKRTAKSEEVRKRLENAKLDGDAASKTEIKLCEGCHKRIEEDFTVALDKPYHLGCLKCCLCKAPLLNEQFGAIKGKPVCKKCFEKRATKEETKTTSTKQQRASLKCDKCHKDIDGEYATFEDRNYHEDCFTCEGCGTSLMGKPFGIVGGDPLCSSCISSGNSEKPDDVCAECGSPITTTTPFVNSPVGRVHSKCFNCSKCGTNLVRQPIRYDDKNARFCAKCLPKSAKKGKSRFCAKCRMRLINVAEAWGSTTGELYHSDCISCEKCGKSFTSQPVFRENMGEMVAFCDKCV